MALPITWRPDAVRSRVSLCCRVQGSVLSGAPGRKGSGAGGVEGKGKGCRFPAPGPAGALGAARHPSHEGYLLLQVVEPAPSSAWLGRAREVGRGAGSGGEGQSGLGQGPQERPSRVGRNH